VVKNAKNTIGFRIVVASLWNVRDRHMADTLDALLAHLSTGNKPAKVIVWAHNSHVGDARQTTMGESGEWTVGQLMRQRHNDATFLLGFTTYSGTVMARRSGITRARCSVCARLFPVVLQRCFTTRV
jgi:erythromycin esterase-like protein